MNNQNKVINTQFEKSVLSIINYLLQNKKRIRLFEHNHELLSELGITQNSWGMYRNGYRHIPDRIHEKIKEVLTGKYHANKEYIRTGKGSMFLKNLIETDQSSSGLEKNVITIENWEAKVEESEALKKENAELIKKNAELLKRIVELQDKLIEAMNGSTKNQHPKVNE